MPAVSLLPRSGMECDETGTGVFEAPRHVEPVPVLIRDTEPELKADMPGIRGTDHGPRAGKGVVGIRQHGDAGALFRHLGHGASHVEVEPDKAPFPEDMDSPFQKFRFGSEKLHHEGRIHIRRGEHLPRVPSIITEALGTHHFRDAACGSVFPAQRPERKIAVSGQGGKPWKITSHRQPVRLRGSHTARAGPLLRHVHTPFFWGGRTAAVPRHSAATIPAKSMPA